VLFAKHARPVLGEGCGLSLSRVLAAPTQKVPPTEVVRTVWTAHDRETNACADQQKPSGADWQRHHGTASVSAHLPECVEPPIAVMTGGCLNETK
jgi:hypothetical protein